MKRLLAWLLLAALLCTALFACAEEPAQTPDDAVDGTVDAADDALDPDADAPDDAGEEPDPAEDAVTDGEEDPADGETPALSAAPEATRAPKKKNGAIAIELNFRNDDDRLVAVDLLQLGGVESIVRFENGEEAAVPTARLLWDNNAEESQRVAYIYAKSASKVTMRLSRAAKSRILQRVPVGKLAFVFDYHSDYTGIICNGTSGYVKTSLLKFLDRKVGELPTGRLSYNGKLESKTKLKLRQTASGNGKVLVSLPAGTRVVIRRVTGEFAEVEALDWHGYVQTRFITLDEGMSFPQ